MDSRIISFRSAARTIGRTRDLADREFGVMKWKHWIGYDWLEALPAEGEGKDRLVIRSLDELMKYNAVSLTPELLLDFMISLHRGLYRIHQSGMAHGNVKPSNVLGERREWERGSMGHRDGSFPDLQVSTHRRGRVFEATRFRFSIKTVSSSGKKLRGSGLKIPMSLWFPMSVGTFLPWARSSFGQSTKSMPTPRVGSSGIHGQNKRQQVDSGSFSLPSPIRCKPCRGREPVRSTE